MNQGLSGGGGDSQGIDVWAPGTQYADWVGIAGMHRRRSAPIGQMGVAAQGRYGHAGIPRRGARLHV
jgi:hypothetical protein